MMTTVLFTGLALLALGVFYSALRGHNVKIRTLDQLEGVTTPLDLAAFQNLLNPQEEAFLRKNLPAADFRKFQRRKARVAIGYLRCAAENASVLICVGEAGKTDPNPEVQAAAAKLITNAVTLRFYALAAMFKLRLMMLFPGRSVSVDRIIGAYSNAGNAVAMLSRLQNPIATPRVLAALM